MTGAVATISHTNIIFEEQKDEFRTLQLGRTVFEPLGGKVANYFEDREAPYKDCPRKESKLTAHWGAFNSLGYNLTTNDLLVSDCFTNAARTCAVITHARHSGEEVLVKIVQKDVKERLQQYKYFMSKLQGKDEIKTYFAEIKAATIESQALYVVMKKADCGNLKQLLRVAGSLDEATCKTIAWQIVMALDVLKESGRLSHRNIKTENVLLYPGCVAKLADVRSDAELEALTDESEPRFFSCPPHRPPELGDDSDCGSHNATAVDVWGVGTIVYHMLCGHEYRPGVLLSRKKGTLPRMSHEAASFLRELLETEPGKRPTIKDALRHPFFHDVPLPFEHCKRLLSSTDAAATEKGALDFSDSLEHDPLFALLRGREVKGNIFVDKSKMVRTFVQLDLVTGYQATNPQMTEEVANVDWNAFALYKTAVMHEEATVPQGAPIELHGAYEQEFFRFLGSLSESDKVHFKALMAELGMLVKCADFGRAFGVRLTRGSFENMLHPAGVFNRSVIDATFEAMNYSAKNATLKAVAMSASQTALIMERGRNAKLHHDVKSETRMVLLPYNVVGNYWILIIMKPLAREVRIIDPLDQGNFFSNDVMTNVNAYFLRPDELKGKGPRRECSYRCFQREPHIMQETLDESGVVISFIARRKLDGKDINIKDGAKRSRAIYAYRLSAALELYKAVRMPPAGPYMDEAESDAYHNSVLKDDVKFYECMLCKAISLSYNCFVDHIESKHPSYYIDVQNCQQVWPRFGDEAHVDVSKSGFTIGTYHVGPTSMIKLCGGESITAEVVDTMLMILVKEHNDGRPQSVARAVPAVATASILSGSRKMIATHSYVFDMKAAYIFLPYEITKGRWILLILEPKSKVVKVLDPCGSEDELDIASMSMTLQSYLAMANGPTEALTTKKVSHVSADRNVKNSGILLIKFVECILSNTTLSRDESESTPRSRAAVADRLAQVSMNDDQYLTADAALGSEAEGIGKDRPAATPIPVFDPTSILEYLKSLEKVSGTTRLGVVNGIPILNSSFQRLYRKNTRIDASIVDAYLHIICSKAIDKAARSVPTPDVLHEMKLPPGRNFEDRLNYPPGYETGYRAMKKDDIASAVSKAATLMPVMGTSGFFSLLIADIRRGCCHVVTTTGSPESQQQLSETLGLFLKAVHLGEGVPISSICLGPYPKNSTAKDKSGLIMLMVADLYVKNALLPSSLPESIVADMRFRVAETIRKGMTPA